MRFAKDFPRLTRGTVPFGIGDRILQRRSLDACAPFAIDRRRRGGAIIWREAVMADEIQFFLSELQIRGRWSAPLGCDGTARRTSRRTSSPPTSWTCCPTEVGIVESPEACHFLKDQSERGQAKINGFAIGEDAQDERGHRSLRFRSTRGLTEVTPRSSRRGCEQGRGSSRSGSSGGALGQPLREAGSGEGRAMRWSSASTMPARSSSGQGCSS